MSFAKTTRWFASSSKTTQLTVFVHSLADPLDGWVAPDGLVEGIYQDNFIKFVGRVLTNPVGVEHSQTTTMSASSFLSNASLATFKLQLVHTMCLGFTICATFWHRALAASTLHTDTIDDKSLLGTISEPAGFVWTARSASSVNPGQLSELPAANPDEEAHDVALLLSVDFLHVLVGPHGERLPGTRRAMPRIVG